MPGAAPGESAADAVGDGAAGLDDADAVGVGWAACRFAGADDRFAEAVGGTPATVAWKGRPAHEPAAAELSAAEPSAAELSAAEPPRSHLPAGRRWPASAGR